MIQVANTSNYCVFPFLNASFPLSCITIRSACGSEDSLHILCLLGHFSSQIFLLVAPLLSDHFHHSPGSSGTVSLLDVFPVFPETPVQTSLLWLQLLHTYLLFLHSQLYPHLALGLRLLYHIHLHFTGLFAPHIQDVPHKIISSKTCCSFRLPPSQWFIPLSSQLPNPEVGGSSLRLCSLLSPKSTCYKLQIYTSKST